VAGRYWAVNIEGTADFINLLKRFDKEVANVLNREMRKGAELVAAAARDKMPDEPLSNWGVWNAAKDGRNLGYDRGEAAAGIKPRNVNRTRRGQAMSWKVTVQQLDPAGAIYSLAGSIGGASGTYRGWTFKNNMNAKNGSGPWPRALTPAYYEKGPEAGDAIAAAIQRAMDQVNNG